MLSLMNIHRLTTTKCLGCHYDQAGQMLGFTLNGVPYFYIRNLQGDVVAIYCADGVIVARYVYDAWGNHVYISDSEIARINPIRYRGYYFDNETQLYYLQSRYYDPVLRRFISADVYMDTGQIPLGTNMYAYCLNDPVNLIDPYGTFAITLTLLTVAVTFTTTQLIVGGTVAAAAIILSHPEVQREVGRVIDNTIDAISTTVIPAHPPAPTAPPVSQARPAAERAATAERTITQTLRNPPPGMQYWEATTRGSIVSLDPTRPLTLQQAASRVRDGQDVFAATRLHAEFLAQMVGGSNLRIIEEIERGNRGSRPGTPHWHFHLWDPAQPPHIRAFNGVHIYFVI